MASSRKARLAKRAKATISRQGDLATKISVAKTNRSNYTSADGWTESTVTHEVLAFPYNFSEVQKTTDDIETGDIQFIFDNDNIGFTPNTQDIWTTEDGAIFKVKAVEGIPSRETAVAWILHMRPQV